MQQRYYDPGIGKFLSVDPVTAYDNGNMRHFNGYAYPYNNPYKFTDPDGRQTMAWGQAGELFGKKRPSLIWMEQLMSIKLKQLLKLGAG